MNVIEPSFVCLIDSLIDCLFVYLFVCLCVCLFVCLFVMKGKFLYSAVSSPQDCSKHLTLYSLADLFNQTTSKLFW